ncbi:hypothetical protein KIPB_002710 [Kipferlia bialata]|uniref:Uncharacterized protein n=1 Tax=Kipferlia bialata TaxID=797122 RepID=A0A9K3CU93_9EUKA|nr:hypothetical protein KIPB_002710 [Kipferlia bialata]|eukprot:g2710.t1
MQVASKVPRRLEIASKVPQHYPSGGVVAHVPPNPDTDEEIAEAAREAEARDTSDSFWAFVTEVDWEHKWNLPSTLELVTERYTPEERRGIYNHVSDLMGGISSLIYSNLYRGLDFVGGDDFCHYDLPAECVARGKAFYYKMLGDVHALSAFAQEGTVHENFSYLFH